MKSIRYTSSILLGMILLGCTTNQNQLAVDAYETSANGNKLTKIRTIENATDPVSIVIRPEETFQTITGFGGAFTESSAYLLNQLSPENRNQILDAYFGNEGARYSLTRTHINSCDFSLTNYSYAPIEGDTELENFSIDEDREDIIPMIKAAMAISSEGFKIIASPWTAPPWMKDNNAWKGGKLLPEYYDTWALFFSKYLNAYKEEGIDIWAITVENEPHGNGENWESMHYTPEEMNVFIKNHLGPKLRKDGHQVNILGYDQNKGRELTEWVEVMLGDKEVVDYLYGTAVHWYTGTVDWFPESLNYTHELAPEKHIIHTEACVDAEVPHWKEDEWYWRKEATDWGYDWAPEEDKPDHPKYVPVYRYARDIVGSLNSWVEGWVDWNMVLDTQGGPNWANNWCVAPVIVDPENDEVYFTPIYYIMSHFSKFIRPGAVRIGFEVEDEELMVTAAQNADGSVIVILLNMTENAKSVELKLEDNSTAIIVSPQALQTIVIPA